MHALLLKAGATALTLLAALASSAYVAGHVKNGAAPLHPAVYGTSMVGGRLTLPPSVRTDASVEAVTSTHAS